MILNGWFACMLRLTMSTRIQPNQPLRFQGIADIDNRPNDLVNLSILCRIRGGEAGAQRGGKALLDGLEGANGRRAAEASAGAQNPAISSN
jgi:hypothetical protein